MGMKSKLILVLVLVFALSTVASASIITGVDRSRGTSGNRTPIGAFTGATDPMPSVSGLIDGIHVFSDRDYFWENTPYAMAGYEYVRTFNTDKASGELDVSYLVTIGEDAPLWIAVDDRLASSSEFGSLLGYIELATYRFPCGVEWADTGINLTIGEGGGRPMSVFVTTEALPAGSYDFGLNPSGNNFYIIGAVPEPMTIALLGLGGLGLIRRKRS
jgi:hypothetical protein